MKFLLCGLGFAFASVLLLSTLAFAAGLTITTTTLANETIGEAYSQTLTATGGTAPYTWSITSGSLPAGLNLESSTGIISGTPTQTGSVSFIAKVTDSVGSTDTRALRIATPLTITTSTLPNGTVDVVYGGYDIAFTGGNPPVTWSIVGGTLPPGLNLVTLGASHHIGGTPTVVGTYTFTVQASTLAA